MSQLPVSPPKETNIDMNDDSSLEDLSSSVIKFCLTEATPYRKKWVAKILILAHFWSSACRFPFNEVAEKNYSDLKIELVFLQV